MSSILWKKGMECFGMTEITIIKVLNMHADIVFALSLKEFRLSYFFFITPLILSPHRERFF